MPEKVEDELAVDGLCRGTAIRKSLSSSADNNDERCPSGFGPPGPNPLADMDRGVHIRKRIWTPPGPNLLADLDPSTKLSENIILNVLVKMDDTLRSRAY